MSTVEAIRRRIQPVFPSSRGEVPYAATISLWTRWFIFATAVLMVVYRSPSPVYGYVVLIVVLASLNGWLHYRLITNRSITLNHLLGMSAVDVILITLGVIVDEGFTSVIFMAYYPAIGSFGLFGSPRLAFIGTTIVAAVYIPVCLLVSPGLDFDDRAEKFLFWRIAILYATTTSIALIVRFERIRRQAAVERERILQRERVELSQTIHDTTAQSAYMIGLGIESAIEQAGDSNEELTATLVATSALARSTMWELRRPIDMGPIFEGRTLSRVLRSLVDTFTAITSVKAELVQSGTEPPLTTHTRTRLFSIVHNALANAFRHAAATRVEVTLDFTADSVRLSVSDDGIGLPEDYAERGRGFSSMQSDAEGMGGVLLVESGGRHGGTTVTCVISGTTEG